MQFADLILPFPLPKLFTYSIPAAMEHQCEIGKRVVVSFGSKKIYTAIVSNIHTNKPLAYTAKSIITVLDEKPIVNALLLKFWNWLANYYLCTIGEVYKAAIPAAMKLESETRLIYNPEFEEEEPLSNNENILIQILKLNNSLTIQELNLKGESGSIVKSVKSLFEKGAISIEEALKETYKPKTSTYVTLAENLYQQAELEKALNLLTKAPVQMQLLMSYLQLSDHFSQQEIKKEVTKKQLIAKSGASASAFNALLERNIFQIYTKEISRLEKYSQKINEAVTLNTEQIEALQKIENAYLEKEVVLLHGVTSSGKTEVYIHLIQKMLQQNKQVLYLLPEIALTTQIIKRLKNVFGEKVGVYHSKFSDAERVEVWQNIDNEKIDSYKLILGVRSSIFLPFTNLGLIIVDEEHENTYKQYDPAPRYNARDAAIVLANFHKAKILLGSATPSIETFYNAKTGKYGLVEMTKRFQDIKLPEIILADMKEARKRRKMISIFTPELAETMKLALQNNEQIILFQNRRGFSTFVECNSCNWVARCKFCDVSLTYHKEANRLICHYCGHTQPIPQKCPACNDISVYEKGLGTEKIEEEVSILFPQARISRMDLDTTRSKKSYERMINAFEKGLTDILIGTQMVTKGFDFNKVSTVGILNADNLINFPDFRAYERSFQLMMQVSGRAGRKNKQGKVIIQTSNPRHEVIQYVQTNNFAELYKSQIMERQQFMYPPFARLVLLTLRHKSVEIINEAAAKLATDLRNTFGQRVLGPEFPPVARIQSYYLKNILVKIERNKPLSKAKEMLVQCVENFKLTDNFKSITVIFNVDPL